MIRKILFFIVLMITPFIVLAYSQGDVNGDNKVNSTDYIAVRKHILKQTKLTGDIFNRGDINNDKKITSLDYIAIRKIILKVNTVTPKPTVKPTSKPTATPKPTNTPKPLTAEEKICESVKNNNSIDYKSFMSLKKNNDDYYVIKAAHNCANKYHKPVVVTKAEYNIYKNKDDTTSPIVIRTNTDLSNSTIYIHDESNVVFASSKNRQSLFEISSYSGCVKKELALSNLKEGATIKELAGSSNGKFVKVYDRNHKVFIRSYKNGKGRSDGADATDAFKVDKNGKILDPMYWSYSNEKREVYMCDIPSDTLTFKNAYIYNIVAKVSPMIKYDDTSYTRRGLKVGRSNVVINNIVHGYLNSKNKKDFATTINYAYYGFFIIQNIADFTIKNSRVYALDSNYENNSGASTYDLILNDVVKATIDNVVMYDYYDDGKLTYFNDMDNQFNNGKYWVVSATNRTKNVTWNNCFLNRIDGVHEGKMNSTIKNSKTGKCITMLGKGNFTIANVAVYNSNSFMCLREEYGQTWDGTLTINGARLYPRNNDTSYIVNMGVTYGEDGYVFNNGYDLYLPKINVNNFRAFTTDKVYVFNNSASNTGKVNGNLTKVKNYIKNNAFKFTYTKKADIKLNDIKNKNGEVKAKNYLIDFGEN